MKRITMMLINCIIAELLLCPSCAAAEEKAEGFYVYPYMQSQNYNVWLEPHRNSVEEILDDLGLIHITQDGAVTLPIGDQVYTGQMSDWVDTSEKEWNELLMFSCFSCEHNGYTLALIPTQNQSTNQFAYSRESCDLYIFKDKTPLTAFHLMLADDDSGLQGNYITDHYTLAVPTGKGLDTNLIDHPCLGIITVDENLQVTLTFNGQTQAAKLNMYYHEKQQRYVLGFVLNDVFYEFRPEESNSILVNPVKWNLTDGSEEPGSIGGKMVLYRVFGDIQWLNNQPDVLEYKPNTSDVRLNKLNVCCFITDAAHTKAQLITGTVKKGYTFHTLKFIGSETYYDFEYQVFEWQGEEWGFRSDNSHGESSVFIRRKRDDAWINFAYYGE